MRRGDIVTVSLAGDYGKPRPALVLQADAFEAIGSVTLAPMTSQLQDAPLIRISVSPTVGNGLRVPSQVMADKLITAPRARIGEVIGSLEPEILALVETAVGRFLGLAAPRSALSRI